MRLFRILKKSKRIKYFLELIKSWKCNFYYWEIWEAALINIIIVNNFFWGKLGSVFDNFLKKKQPILNKLLNY